MIPISRPDLGPEEIAAATDVLRGGQLGQGPRVADLEERWAERIGVAHAIAVSSGTVALMSILAGLGLGPGDEVITVAYTATATANAILSTGATPVFVDIEPDTYLVDAKRIEAAITSRSVAIVPVHLAGLVADMDMIRAIADRYGLAVVEDACQAPGATFRGRAAGSFGHGAFSLGATSNLTAGEGGFITTHDARLASWLRQYRNHGSTTLPGLSGPSAQPDASDVADVLGYNFRLTELAAAIGLAQLAKLDRNTARRRAIATAYDEAFSGRGVLTPVTPVGRTHVFNDYTLRVGPARDAILADIRATGVDAALRYPIPVHRHPYVQERGLYADLPVTDLASAETLSLPLFAGLANDEQERVIEATVAAIERHVGRRDAATLIAPEPATR